MTDQIFDSPLTRPAPWPENESGPRRPRSGIVFALRLFALLVVGAVVSGLLSTIGSFGRALGPLSVGTAAFAGLVFLVCAVLWGRWQLRAARNARSMSREPLRFSPVRGYAAFVIPGPNLVWPFQAVLEIHNASHGRPLRTASSSLLRIWWAASAIAPLIGGAMLAFAPVSIAIAVFGTVVVFFSHVVGALTAARMIRDINRAQAAAVARWPSS